MTEIRAREIDPSLVEGIGVSTTLISGDCRPMPMRLPSGCAVDPHPRCFNGRTSMRVLLLPTNISIPKADECMGGHLVSDLMPHAIIDAHSSDAGELAAAARAGRYALYISKDDHCAICGLPDGGAACLIDIPKGGVAAKDLVFDEAAH